MKYDKILDKQGFIYGFTSVMIHADKIRIAFLVLLIAGLVFAQEGLGGRFYNLLDYVCSMLVTLLPVVAIALLVMAAVVYGVGHIFGSETKTKAQSWATSMIIGTIIAIIIFLIAKPIVTILLGEEQIGQLPEDFCIPGKYLE